MALRPPRSGFSVARRLSERSRAARTQSEGDPLKAAEAVGLGGVVEALRGLVEQLTNTAREAGSDSADGVSHTASFGGETARVVFGYTVRMGRDGVSAEPFGDVPAASAGPAARQPIAEMFEDGDAVVVVAELPGADPEGIMCRVEGAKLLIEASGAQRYRKELVLPAPVLSKLAAQSFRNGILEVRLTRAVTP